MVIEITLSAEEQKVMESICIDPQGFVQNFVQHRIDLVLQQITPALMAHCNENNIAISVGVENQINQAEELGILKSATARNAEFIAAHTETP